MRFVVSSIFFCSSLSSAIEVEVNGHRERQVNRYKACQAFIEQNRNCRLIRQDPVADALRGVLVATCQKKLQDNQCEKLKVPSENLIQCTEEEVCKSRSENLSQMILACGQGFYKWGKEAAQDLMDSFQKISQNFKAEQKCNSDLVTKKNMYEKFNVAVPEVLKKVIPDDKSLDQMNCSEIARSISASYQMQMQNTERKIRAFQDSNPKLKNQAGAYPKELEDYRSWSQAESDKQSEHLRKVIAGLSQTPDVVVQKLKELGIKLDCYNSDTQSEIVCKVLAPQVLGLTLGLGSAYLYDLYALTRSEQILKQISAGERYRKSGRAELALERRTLFMTTYAEKEIVSRDAKLKWKALADSAARDVKIPQLKFFTLENAKMKELNDSLKQEDLVSALTHHRQEIQLQKLKELEAQYKLTNPDLKFHYFADFKSLRLAIEGDAPADLASKLEKVTLESQKKFDQSVKDNFGVVRSTDETDSWFRSSVGESDDSAAMAARFARSQEPGKLIDAQNDLQFKSWANQQLETALSTRQELEFELKQTNLMEKRIGEPATLRTEALDILRKNKDNLEQARQLLKNEFGLADLSTAQVEKMKKYASSVDNFSPSLRVVDREFASLRNAEYGGVAVDMKGLGAENLDRTARALSQSSTVKEAQLKARQAEQVLTEEINQRRENFKGVIKSQFGSKDLEVSCSGDGCTAFLKNREMSASEIQKINQALAQTGEAGRMRLSAQTAVKDQELRDQVKKTGEDLEKKLSTSLSGSFEPRKLKGLVLGVRMADKPELIISEANGFKLTPSERKLIQNKFDQLK